MSANRVCAIVSKNKKVSKIRHLFASLRLWELRDSKGEALARIPLKINIFILATPAHSEQCCNFPTIRHEHLLVAFVECAVSGACTRTAYTTKKTTDKYQSFVES